MSILIRSIVVLASLISLEAHAAARDAGDPMSRAIERRAVEVANWGMSAVNTDLMRQEMLGKTQGKINQVLYWSRPADAKNQTLTPNPDSIYFMVFYDTKDVGPMVIEIPPADTGSFAGSIVDVWQMPLADIGPDGEDKGKGGKYLILPPGYAGERPSGYIVLPNDTFTGYALLRSNLVSHSDADIAKSVAYGKRIKVYPLTDRNAPQTTTFADAYGVLFDATIRYDASFYQSLDHVIQHEPWLERDRAMIDPLRTLGIEKGKPFKPDETTTHLLDEGISEAHEWLAARYDRGFPPYNPGIHWTLPTMPDIIAAYGNSYGDQNAYPVDTRGVSYTYAFIGIKHLGAAQFYLISIKDKNGQAYDGAKTYRLTVPANPPAKQYWSVTAYDREIHTILKTARASRSSQIPGLKKNADGSVDIYFGPKAPEGLQENWVPTDPKRKFELMFRFYGPEKALFEKTWKLPDVELVQ
jgi:hypothetical protein